jgi:sulfopyruvate decarboxylase subunit alpha
MKPVIQNFKSEIDERIAGSLARCGTSLACFVPCGLLDGVFERLSNLQITSILATREEEGVGICAGAYLGGARPALLMQNSGLGNSINALLSLTRYYRLGLLLVIGFRGRTGEEEVEAQIPMGRVTQQLLSIIGSESETIENTRQISLIKKVATQAFERGTVGTILLPPKLWKTR